MVAKYEEEISKLKNENQLLLVNHQKLIEKMQEEHNSMQKDYEEKLSQLNDKYNKLQELKQKLDQDYANVTVAKNELEQKVENMILEIESMKKSHQEEIRDLKMLKNQEQSALETKYKETIEKLINDQIHETEDIKIQFAGAQELLNQKYTQLEERYDELQGLYDNRPSRSEDVELIRQLQEQWNEKDAQLKKAEKDMEFYKLELLNREDNYNKVFGSKPVVGIYNPLAAKVFYQFIYRMKRKILGRMDEQ